MKSHPPGFEKDLLAGDRGPDSGHPDNAFSIEEALGEGDDSLKTIFNNVNAVIVRLDKYGRITHVNARAEDCFGYKPEEVIGKHFATLGIFSIKDLTKLMKLFSDAVKGNLASYLDEIEATHKNGHYVLIKLYSTVVKKDGQVDGIISIIHDITEQKQAEEARRDSEDKYRQIFDNIDAVIVRLNKFGKITEINPRVEQLFGFKREDVLGKHFAKLGILTAKDLPKIVKLFGDAISGKQLTYHDELETRDQAGNKKYIDVNCSVIKKDGRIDSTISIIHDVTERRKAEEALRLSEQKYAGLVEHGNDGMLIIQDRVIKYVNSKLLDIFGYPYEEVVGKQFASAIAEEYQERVIARSIKRLAGEEVPEKYEFDIINKKGERVNLEVNASLMEFEGRPADMAIVRDITERRKNEEALRMSEETFSKVFHGSPNPICIISIETEIFIDINESYTRFTGYPREETIGRTSKELGLWVNEDDLKTMRSIIMQKGRMSNHQFSTRTKSGEIRTGLFSAEIVTISGKPCMVLVITDITEQKWAEDALKESEEFTSSLLTHTPNPIFVTYPDSAIKYVNPAFEELTGFTLTDIIGMKMPYPWWPPETRGEIATRLKESTFGDGKKREMAYQKKNGELFIVELNATIINKNGQRQYILVTWIDITERKQMETALRESEEKFFKAFNASANAICITSLKDRCFIEANESFTRFTGYTHEEVIGHSAADFNLWVNNSELQRGMEELEKYGQVYNQEFRSRMKSGEIRVGLSSVEIINIGGEPCRMVVITDITERKKTEEALKESEEKFSRAFLASPGAIAIATVKDGRFIDVNESFFEVMGYSREEAIGHTSTELKIFAGDESHDKLLNDIKFKGNTHNKIIKFRRKSGEIGTGLFSAERIIINNEPCLISINMDITEQKKTEESLRLLGSVTQQVTDSIVVNDPEFKITYMNKSAQDLFGYSIDEALGKDSVLFDATPPPKSIRKDIMDAVKTGKIWNAVLTKRRKDGSTFLCDCRRSPLFDEDGHLTSYIVVYRDITEQKETDAKLKAQKLMVESILTSMPEGVLVTDSSDRIMLANESFRRIFHTDKRVIDNKLVNEVLHVEQLTDLYTSIKTGKTDSHSLEFRYKVKATEKIIACVIVRMDSERMLLIFSDVSREREEEDKLYLTDRLASLGQMAAGLAHELNNPLTGILTLSQLLVNSDLPDEHKEDLQCVYDEAKRAANIVKNVLLFTRNNSYENGKSSINEVVKEILRLREHEEKVKNIDIVTNLQDNLPEIQLDKYQLQQVFLNIILNAEAAIEEAKRPGTLTVTTERVNNHVNIMFSDTGCGIKKNVLPRIFDPFFTTKEIGKGTGLGLSICYGIIVKHDGKIGVKTQVGKGTTFSIRMPIANK